ncbi:suppressor of cytokine signaling 1 [Paramormyrops kingsleyae]|uniref:suppressor of cytokine signaling 1 n=1 Tax=Paramormyrops kingsleyae TaxID=1676925 RepID=UPI000CD5FDA4|nr:suppressor of cytokine signaling 1 [Paramormyrops kingsleyae]XP_023670738.1 suppressor of cytokine signaling 1 [Paramormyrops kingsleyae]XP_023670739.1 suppressor of cytokine signaling 1 [Paramormyrops kingsleyae]XP_023670740.1 suppressor of cytokine signaling 1 [Paramormyrops kingsleyae]XP_023670741.1 suppressor of cytokine signaling 1 [Paramormyrops kingsleyae]XP_023670742.1 suppressor of cytokine signaling 1 [Paramormyrops kingsleyae]XP_023670744.1 suppressor of cytokine signaling 1 [Pa
MVARNNLEGNSVTTESRASTEHPHQNRQNQRTPPSQENGTWFRCFRNDEYKIITMTITMLERSGFYWAKMEMEEAHRRLKQEPLGTFLIRDSKQKDTLFTLSYLHPTGPTSVRIKFHESRFSLTGSHKSFVSLFKLLEHYIASPKKYLIRPYRKTRVQPLQELCRKRIIETCGDEKIDLIPVNAVLKEYLNSFPYRI